MKYQKYTPILKNLSPRYVTDLKDVILLNSYSLHLRTPGMLFATNTRNT